MNEPIREFMEGVRRGDRDAVSALLARSPELVDAHDPSCFGAIPLRHAVERGDRAMIDLLLDAGADIDRVSDWWAGGFGVLPCADESIAEYLVGRGYTMNAYAAAGMGWLDRLEQVLDADPTQVHRKFGDGQRALHVAKTVDTIDLLVERGAELDARDVDHCATAAQYLIGDAERCDRLIEHGAMPDIFIACRLGHVDLAELLLDTDPDAFAARVGEPPFDSPGSQGGHIYTYQIGYTCRPLFLAARHGHEDFLEALLPRAGAKQQLSFLAWEGKTEDAAKLLRETPGLLESLDPREQALLADAAWERRTGAVRTMLELGFPVDARSVHESSALDRAAFHGFDDAIEALLGAAASVELVNEFGGTPLDACLHGMVHGWRKDGDYTRSVRLLVEAGSRIDPRWVPSGNAEVDDLLRAALDKR